jgi:hypothetical protein
MSRMFIYPCTRSRRYLPVVHLLNGGIHPCRKRHLRAAKRTFRALTSDDCFARTIATRRSLAAQALTPCWTTRSSTLKHAPPVGAAIRRPAYASGGRGVSTEGIARLVGHAFTRTTEIVYRRELRPVITTGAEIMDQLFTAT